MSTSSTSPAPQLAMIGSVLIDCVRMETYGLKSDVTDLPVEKGSDLTDNIRPRPMTVVKDCVVSNTPINAQIIANRGTDAPSSSASDVYQYLKVVRDNRTPVTIRTSLDTYQNMALEDLSITRSIDSADALFFTATFKHVRVASVNRSRPPVASPSGVARHTKTAAPVPATNTNALFSVIIATDDVSPLPTYYWYDVAIGGWRAQAAPLGSTAYKQLQAAATVGGASDPTGAWYMVKGRPYNVTYGEWNANQSDSYWQAAIATNASVEAVGGVPIGSPWADSANNTGVSKTLVVPGIIYFPSGVTS